MKLVNVKISLTIRSKEGRLQFELLPIITKEGSVQIEFYDSIWVNFVIYNPKEGIILWEFSYYETLVLSLFYRLISQRRGEFDFY